MKFSQESAPKSAREIKSPQVYNGRVVAIDASMCLYQFPIMIRENRSGTFINLTNEDDQVTSHINGMLTRTIRLMENGIRAVYVCDGKPPQLKLSKLEARRAKRTEAETNLQQAMEAGDSEQVLKNMKMTTKVTREQKEQTETLLWLMGIPVVAAPSEAEATCTALCRDGKVHAAATEDADRPTFGTRLLIRNLMAAASQRKQIYGISLELILEQLGIRMDQFIDFCTLCGCDYCDTLRGVGPSTATKLIMTHGSLEKVQESLDSEKVPEKFKYQAARGLFRECEAVGTDSVEFEFKEPDFEGLAKSLVEGSSFARERVGRYIDRLKAARSRTKQKPLSSFFGAPKVEIKDRDKFDPNKRRGGAKAKTKAGGEKRKAVGSTGGQAKQARAPACA